MTSNIFKLLSPALLAWLLLAHFSGIQAQTVSPIGYWRFEAPGDTLDISGNNHHLSQGSLVTGSVDGLAGDYAVLEAGALPSAPSPDITTPIDTAITFEFWFKARRNNQEGQFRWRDKYYFFISEQMIQFRVYERNPGGPPLALDLNMFFNGIGVLDANKVLDGDWHHFVGEYSAKTGVQRIYIDGVTSEEMVAYHGTGRLLNRSLAFDFQLTAGPVSALLEGFMDEVALYDTILAPELIRLHYEQGRSGNAYTFATPPANPAYFPPSTSQVELHGLDFGPGYPDVPVTSLDLLEGYPWPRYAQGAPFRRLVPWLSDNENRNWFGHGPTLQDRMETMKQSLARLAEDYNYYLYMGNVGETFGIIVNPNQTLDSTKDAWHYLDLVQDPALSAYPRFMLSNWRFKRASYKDPLRPKAPYGLNNGLPDSYYLRDTNEVKLYIDGDFRPNYSMARPQIQPDFRLDSIRYDGEVYSIMLDSIMAEIADPGYRYIDMVGENGEVLRPISWLAVRQDTGVRRDGCLNNYPDWFANGPPPCSVPVLNPPASHLQYQGLRGTAIREAYAESFLDTLAHYNGLLSRPLPELLWYDVDGSNLYYPEARSIEKYNDGYTRASPYVYPQGPSRTLRSTSNLTGLERVLKGMPLQLFAGDSLMNIAVSPGYSDGVSQAFDTSMVRPGQYLGLLKAMSFLGADTYTAFMYHGISTNVVPSRGTWRMNHLAMPAYAQAIASRHREFWYNGMVLGGDSSIIAGSAAQSWYSFNTESPNDLIIVRKAYGKDRYLITASIQKRSNMESAGFLRKDVSFRLRDSLGQVVFNDLQFEAALQGSTYLLDLEGGDTIFYQVDAWHEWKYPWHWCRDFVFEGEDFDSLTTATSFRIRTEAPGLATGDFRDYESYLDCLGAGESAFFRFKPRFEEQDTLYFWARMRRGSAPFNEDVSLLLDGNVVQANVPVSSTAFQWYALGSDTVSLQEVHELELRCLAGNLDFDKLMATRSPAQITTAPFQASVSVDSAWHCYGDTVFFSNASSFFEGCVEHQWDFGDGKVSYDFAPSHVYSFPGTYTVVYTLVNACMDTLANDTLTLTLQAPLVDAGLPITGCPNDSLQLQGSSNAPFTWLPDPGILGSLGVLDPFVSVDSTHYFYLQATDSLGCSLTDSVRVDIVALYPANPTTKVCVEIGGSVVLQPQNLGAYVIWQGDPSLDTTQSAWAPTASPAVTTTYYYETMDICGCQVLFDSIVAVVPAEDAIQSLFTTICPGDSFLLQANPNLGQLYTWTPVDNFTEPDNNSLSFLVWPDQTTNYFLEIVDTFSTCTWEDTVAVEVLGSPFEITTPDSSTICEGYTLDLQTSQTSVGSLQWSPSSVTPSNSPSPSVPVLGPTMVVATYTTSISGPTCVFRDSVFLDIDSACCTVPGADFKLLGESSCNLASPALANCNPCSGLTLHIVDTFFVDCNLELVGCTLAMDTNAVIWVDSSVTFTLDSSWVYGACGEMWDGIYVTDNSSLVQVLFGSRLQDGKQALVSRQNGRFRIEGASFLNNWISLRVEDGLPGQPHLGRVVDSDFRSRPGDMLPPLAGRWADAAVFVQAVENLEVGGGDPAQGNRFDSLACGILSYTSNLSLRNNEFRHIFDPPLTNSPNVIGAGHGKAVASIGLPGGNQLQTFTLQLGTGANDGNRFFNCPSGVWVLHNQNIVLLGNRFERIGRDALRYRQCYQDEVRVEGNTFVDVRTSVRGLLSTGAQVDILDNSITNSAGYSGQSIVLMDVNTLGAPQPGGFNVEGNTIRTFGTGIFCNAVGNLAIRENRITVLGRQVPNGYGAGIELDGLGNGLVRENDLFFEPDPAVFIPAGTRFVGIWVEMSDGVDMLCNDTYDWYEHIRMDGPLVGADIRGNTLYDRSVGAVGPQVGMRFRTGTLLGFPEDTTRASGNQWLKANPNKPFTFSEHWVCGQGDRFMVDWDVPSQINDQNTQIYVLNSNMTNPLHPDVAGCVPGGLPNSNVFQLIPGPLASFNCDEIDDQNLGGQRQFWEGLLGEEGALDGDAGYFLVRRWLYLSQVIDFPFEEEALQAILQAGYDQASMRSLIEWEMDLSKGKAIEPGMSQAYSPQDSLFKDMLQFSSVLFENGKINPGDRVQVEVASQSNALELGKGVFLSRTLLPSLDE